MTADSPSERTRDEWPTNRPLEAPVSWDDLYLYRGDEVSYHRPLITGDVVEGVSIPGISSESETVIVLTHPCAMRAGNGQLVERIMVAPVRPHQALKATQWTGFARIMPLPELVAAGHFAAYFLDQGPVPGAALDKANRIACLSDTGISLLHQRLINHMARLTVPQGQLFETSAAVLSEVELCEEWMTSAVDAGVDPNEAEAAFNSWIRSDSNGATFQDRLKNASDRAAVRRQMLRTVRERGW
jgi:hypothetical protein